MYVLDTSSFIVLGNYFPERFPSFWGKFDELVSNQKIVSVREVYRELDNHISRQHLREWMEANKSIFLPPSSGETKFIREIFSVQHFRHLLKQKQRLTSGPAADAFVIASAKIRGYCVVTEEAIKENAAKIPNVCEHFSIDCISLESLMTREGWEF